MYTKKYTIKSTTSEVYNWHVVELEIHIDGDCFYITKKDKDTNNSEVMLISKDNAIDLRDIIEEILDECRVFA